MDLDKLTQTNVLSRDEILVNQLTAKDNIGIGVRQFTTPKAGLSPNEYTNMTMKLVSEILKEIELQNLIVNEVGIQVLEDTIHSVFKLVVVQNNQNLLIGGTIAKKLADPSGLKLYDYLMTLNFMSNDEDGEIGFTPDRLNTVAVVTIPLNLLGGLNNFGDNITFDHLFKPD